MEKPSSNSPLRITGIRLSGDRSAEDPELKRCVAQTLKVDETQIISCEVLRRSLDRRQRPIVTQFNVAIRLESFELEEACLKTLSRKHQVRRLKKEETGIRKPNTPSGHTLIVGAGPAGLMAAWALILEGRQVTVLERGDDVTRRLPAVGHFWARGDLDPESNVCFGEGGAGAFSDGKLITRNRSSWRDFVLGTLVDFGADPTILTESQAHVGSDRLRRIISSWRKEMIARGVNFRFRTRVADLIKRESRVIGVRLLSGEEIFADRVLWATGGHARDSLEILVNQGVRVQPRGLAIGVRIEHPQSLVNRALAGYDEGPACEYKLRTRIHKRGVFSFCMCPGGVVVAAASAAKQQVVNGMSCHGKRSRYANSALVVEVGPEQFPEGSLGGLDFQRVLEKRVFSVAEGYRAPAQRVTDFLKKSESATLPKTSYRPGVVSHNLHDLLPPDVSEHLVGALPEFARQLKGYVTEEALMIAIETRTSCPLTVVRDDNDGKSTFPGLYCVGEGAGYAGGILSAAYDAVNLLNFLSNLPN